MSAASERELMVREWRAQSAAVGGVSFEKRLGYETLVYRHGELESYSFDVDAFFRDRDEEEKQRRLANGARP